jgi:hypothetical protein
MIPGPTFMWRRKPQAERKNVALLSDLHFNFKCRSVQSQACSGQSTLQCVKPVVFSGRWFLRKRSNWQRAWQIRDCRPMLIFEGSSNRGTTIRPCSNILLDWGHSSESSWKRQIENFHSINQKHAEITAKESMYNFLHSLAASFLPAMMTIRQRRSTFRGWNVDYGADRR